MVDDDLEVAVRAALVLERVLDLGYRALERREVVLAHGRRAVGVEDRLAVLEANRLRANREARTSVFADGAPAWQFFNAAINERECLITRGFLPRGPARVFRVLLRPV